MDVQLKEFKMPEGTLSENEQKGIAALAEWMSGNLKAFADGIKSEKELAESVTKQLEEKGFRQETIEGIKKSLLDQGKVLTSLKENPYPGMPKMTGLKKAFFDQYDGLVQAVKNGQQGYTIKAIDEVNPDLIHMTTNTVTTTTGAVLAERSGEDATLYLKRRDRQYIRDIANITVVQNITSDLTFYEEGDEEGHIAIVKENGLKPQVKLNLIKNKVEVQKAAAWISVTEEMMKFRPRAWAAIQRLFRDKFSREYDELLTTQMLGNATSYISTPLDGTIPESELTDFTALVAGILQLESLNFAPDVLVINPADKWRLALSQTKGGIFVLPYIQNGGQFGLLGLRVVTTNKMEAGKFLIGESGTWNIEEESPSLRTGLLNDDIIHNRQTIVMETYFLSYVPSNNAGAWLMGDFADIKEALLDPVV